MGSSDDVNPDLESLWDTLAKNGHHTADTAELDLKGRRLFFAIGASVGGKRSCVLESGRLTLCPPGTQEGDRIAYIRGVSVPFVLRKSCRRHNDYQLVGAISRMGLRMVVRVAMGGRGLFWFRSKGTGGRGPC